MMLLSRLRARLASAWRRLRSAGRPSQPFRAELGRRGEDVAARFLRKKGYKLLDRNVRCGPGEIDVIALDGDAVVFVEVRTRSGEADTLDAEMMFPPSKLKRFSRTARTYIARTRLGNKSYRFDVIAVSLVDGAPPAFDHIEGAIEANY